MTENGLNSTFVIEHRTFATVMGDYLKENKNKLSYRPLGWLESLFTSETAFNSAMTGHELLKLTYSVRKCFYNKASYMYDTKTEERHFL